MTFDFAQGLLDFNDLSVHIPSIGFSVQLLKYWDGQPVTFQCRNRSGTKVFFSVAFEIADPEGEVGSGEEDEDEDEDEKEEEGSRGEGGEEGEVRDVSDEID